MRLVVYLALFGTIYSAGFGDFPALSNDPALNPLPPEALAFPEFSENYKLKITHGDYEIWSEEKLRRWVSAQGLSVTRDNPGAGLAYGRVAVVTAPGLKFSLRRPVTEKGSEFANGWKLNLDIAAISGRDGRPLSEMGNQYNNLLVCDIFIDNVWYKTVKQGAGTGAVTSPVQIQIPHIRSGEGKVEVYLKLANHPRNFLFLYDAYLSR